MASARSDQKSRPRGGAQGAAQPLLICAPTSLSRGPSLAAPQDLLELCVDFRHHSRAETAPNRETQRQVVEAQCPRRVKRPKSRHVRAMSVSPSGADFVSYEG